MFTEINVSQLMYFYTQGNVGDAYLFPQSTKMINDDIRTT